MGKYVFDESDLDDETAIYIDKYFKKVIINAKKQYLGRLAKDTRIILNTMEELRINKNELCNIEDLTYEEFVIDDLSVRVYNEDTLRPTPTASEKATISTQKQEKNVKKS